MKQRYLFIITLFLFFSSACREDRIKIEGVEKIDIPVCDRHPLREYRIEDQSSFNILLKGFIDNGICESFEIPELDFDEVSVLGFETVSANCDNDYSVSVDAIPEESSYEYRVNVRINDKCVVEERQMHWVSLPKIPADYMIDYTQVDN